jgi:hypothetical protein
VQWLAWVCVPACGVSGEGDAGGTTGDASTTEAGDVTGQGPSATGSSGSGSEGGSLSTTSDGETTATVGEASSGSGGSSGTPIDAEFEEIDGLVSVEAEHYFEQNNNEPTLVYWYTFAEGEADPEVDCVTNTPCDAGTAPMCNQYPECDPDAIDPAEASNGAYVESLPDRRRDDSEPGTGELGVVNDQENAAALHYRVLFHQAGRYYVWGRARGEGPAANGVHLGIDGTWPDNDLVDPSSMRMQFPNGWAWTQNRRGGTQHTGVAGTDDVSVRDANIWLEIDRPGVHTITWAMREDGLELDKFVMVLDPDFVPEGEGPPETILR